MKGHRPANAHTLSFFFFFLSRSFCCCQSVKSLFLVVVQFSCCVVCVLVFVVRPQDKKAQQQQQRRVPHCCAASTAIVVARHHACPRQPQVDPTEERRGVGVRRSLAIGPQPQVALQVLPHRLHRSAETNRTAHSWGEKERGDT